MQNIDAVIDELERVTRIWEATHRDDFLDLEYEYARDALAWLKVQRLQIESLKRQLDEAMLWR